MKPQHTTLMLSIVLIVISAWAYLGSETPSFTALIPGGFGVAIGLCYPGVRKENKVVAHIAAVLVVLVTLALLMPLKGAIGRGDVGAIGRVGAMWLASVVTLISYILSFVRARRGRG